jgi:hypothetical protein
MNKKLNQFLEDIRAEEQYKTFGPSPDIAICSKCGGRFGPGEYTLEWESDGWENPEYQVACCPNCEDGGDIVDWDFSPEQWKLHEEWEKKKKNETSDCS